MWENLKHMAIKIIVFVLKKIKLKNLYLDLIDGEE